MENKWISDQVLSKAIFSQYSIIFLINFINVFSVLVVGGRYFAFIVQKNIKFLTREGSSQLLQWANYGHSYDYSWKQVKMFFGSICFTYFSFDIIYF